MLLSCGAGGSMVPFIGRLSPTDDESPRPTTTLLAARGKERGEAAEKEDGRKARRGSQ